jgi:radical SAM protein with 4Fe4S-binding SPASM domain
MTAKIKPQYSEERIDLALSAPLSVPLVIYIEASSHCNLECVFCPQHLNPERMTKTNMSIDVFKKAIDDIKAFDRPLKMLRMCGTGDPLFNKKIPEMIAYAYSNRNFDKFELITNGLLLNEVNTSVLLQSLDRIIISIEGLNDEDYHKFTKRKINFEEFYTKLTLLSKLNRSCKLHFKIHNQAVSSPQKKELFFSLFKHLGDEIFIENLVDLWPDTDSNYVNVNFHRFKDRELKEIKVCSQIFKTMQVNSDGSVIPCSIDWEAMNQIGNLSQSSLKEIWNGEEMRKIRIKHLEGRRLSFSPCKDCSFNETSDLDNIDIHAQEILQRVNQHNFS